MNSTAGNMYKMCYNICWIVCVLCTVLPVVQLSGVPSIVLCNQRRVAEHYLNASGYDSSVLVTMGIGSGEQVRGPCKLRVVCPESHTMSISFATVLRRNPSVRPPSSAGNASSTTAAPPNTNSSCMLSIYRPDQRRKPVLKIDLCRDGQKFPPATLLLTSQMRIVWMPPSGELPEFVSRLQLVVTAVGKGDFCMQAGQHTCMTLGFKPVRCVAEELMCDGIQHCPRDDPQSDEDREMCIARAALHRTSWEYIAHELFKKISAHQRTNNLPAGSFDGNRWIHRNIISNSIVSTTPHSVLTKDSNLKDTRQLDSISAALSHYGPWGYLMLGMLICGTVLMFCGLWECCCRKSKPAPTPIRRTTASSTRTATVLILSPTNEEYMQTPGPPSYDELDQPPTYAALFPESKRNSLILNPLNLIPRQSTMNIYAMANATAESEAVSSPPYDAHPSATASTVTTATDIPTENLQDSRDLSVSASESTDAVTIVAESSDRRDANATPEQDSIKASEENLDQVIANATRNNRHSLHSDNEINDDQPNIENLSSPNDS